MANFLDDLKKALDSFKSVKADIEEIRKCKGEIQSLKNQLCASVQRGQYIRDDSRVIISAPEIIIGNVDHAGNLLSDGGSVVVVRGNDVRLQATGSPGTGGTVETKASRISQVAVDPGRDGLENVVWTGSSRIENKAVSISLNSEDSSGTMVGMRGGSLPGVNITSETGITLDAAPSNKFKQNHIDSLSKSAGDASKLFSSQIDHLKSRFDSMLATIMKTEEESRSMYDTETSVRSRYLDIQDIRSQMVYMQSELVSVLDSYVRYLSLKAEADRQKESLRKMKDELGKKSADFPKKTTSSSVSVRSETLRFSSTDGDGNIRENPEAGLFVSAPHIGIAACDAKGALIKDSSMGVNVLNFSLSTQNARYEGEKRDKGTFPSEGKVTFISKEFNVGAVDTELKDKKIAEKALTMGGSFNVRAENISIESTDTEGKSVGTMKLNAKDIKIASMDVDKEKRTDTAMAAGSQMVLLSEKMFTGSLDKKNKSKLVQVVSDKVGIMGDSTAEMQQGEGKAVLTLEGGNLSAGGGKNEFSGDTTISGKADIKGDVEAPNGKFKGVEASGKFTSPNISDGMMGGTAGPAGKPSAKMKMEEAQKQKQKQESR